MRPLERALIQSAQYSYKKGQRGHTRDTREAHSQRRLWGRSEKMAISAKREASGETNRANTLTLDLSAPEMEEINFCSLRHWVCSSLLWQP